MNKLLILLSFSSLIGCGQVEDFIRNEAVPSDPRQFRDIQPELRDFYIEFENETGVSAWHVTSGIAELDDSKVAICTTWGGKYPQITYNSKHWDKDSYDQKHQTMFHEFGHCVLGLGHRDEYENGCPVSIMNKFSFSSYHINNCYLPLFNNYVLELLN